MLRFVVLTIATEPQYGIAKSQRCSRFSGRLQQEINMEMPFPCPCFHDGLEVVLGSWRPGNTDTSHGQ